MITGSEVGRSTMLVFKKKIVHSRMLLDPTTSVGLKPGHACYHDVTPH
jgi:hypothetical protein